MTNIKFTSKPSAHNTAHA